MNPAIVKILEIYDRVLTAPHCIWLGMFRCRGERRCIRQNQICDGKIDCIDSGDDEELCHFAAADCPKGCLCAGYAIKCVQLNITEVSGVIFSMETDLLGVGILSY